MGAMFSFSPVTGDVDCCDFSKMMESGLAITTAKFPQDPGIHVFGFHGLTYVQVPLAVLNLIFSYNRRHFIPPVPSSSNLKLSL